MKRIPEAGEAWGILGGTFDPIHNGHINLALEICTNKNLAGVLCIPAFNHPFKPDRTITSYAHRKAMLKNAICDISQFELCEIEKENQLSGYTIDTVRELKKRFPRVIFYFIIGADNIAELKSWRAPKTLARLVRIIAGKRPGSRLRIISELPIETITTSEVDISSTELRELLSKKKYTIARKYMNEQVLEYIREKGLYL